MKEFIIDQKEYKKDKVLIIVYIIFWILWTPVTLFVLALVFTEFNLFYCIWLIFGFFAVIGIPYSLLTMNKSEKVIVDNDNVIFINTEPFPKNKITIPKNQIKQFSLEFYDDESIKTINVFNFENKRKVTLAMPLNLESKKKIIANLETFFISNNLSYEFIEK